MSIARLDVHVSDTDGHRSGSGTSLSAGAKAGIIIGIVIVFLLIAAVMVCLFRRRSRARANPLSNVSVEMMTRDMVKGDHRTNSATASFLAGRGRKNRYPAPVRRQDDGDQDGEPWPGDKRAATKTEDPPPHQGACQHM